MEDLADMLAALADYRAGQAINAEDVFERFGLLSCVRTSSSPEH